MRGAYTSNVEEFSTFNASITKNTAALELLHEASSLPYCHTISIFWAVSPILPRARAICYTTFTIWNSKPASKPLPENWTMP
ncbi:MAG: hypothetical protein ACI9VS_000423 [Candidatus Binatia bacterium]